GGPVAERRHREAAQPELPPPVRGQPRGGGLRLAGAPFLPGLYAGHRGPERRALRPTGAGRRADARGRARPRVPDQPRGGRQRRAQHLHPALRGRRATWDGARRPRVHKHQRAGRPDLAGHPVQPRRQGGLPRLGPGPPKPGPLPRPHQPQAEGL
ncbi:MAG: hypothetical protein AVDCRST_MAG12-398, partial [uncultured Rubrobacteraceae bacterium]